jgi:hypothetical protein
MRRRDWLTIGLLALAAMAPAGAGTRGADELFWLPTIEQALEMAKSTRRPIFMTFYTCVGKQGRDTATYTGKRTVW